MRSLAIGAIALGLLGASPSPSPPPTTLSPVETARVLLDTMLRTGHAEPGWFSPSFLAQIPASKVDDVIAAMTKTLGAYQRIEYTPEKFIAHFSKGNANVFIHLDSEYKIDGLIFRPASAPNGL